MASEGQDVVHSVLAAASSEAAHSFEQLCSLLYDTTCEDRSALTQHMVEDQLARFRIWSGNIGAFKHLPSMASLDYRLRESPNIATQVYDHLRDLMDCLITIRSIALGKQPNRPINSDDEDEYENSDRDDICDAPKLGAPDYHGIHSTEAEESFGTIKDTITGLFRLSMLIRRHSPRDRFARALSGPNPFDEVFDVAHVAHKFPKLNQTPNEWLKLRLGRAITQRRRYLQYAREHREKLGRAIEGCRGPTLSAQRFAQSVKQLDFRLQSESGLMNVSEHPSTLQPTIASTLLPMSSAVLEEPFEDSQSYTSFANSLGDEGKDNEIRLPTLSDVSEGYETFECPFCWTIQSFSREAAWRKHVLTDLRPYICTFDTCDLKLFSNRETWFQHELSYHRKTWACPFCQKVNFQDPDLLRQHLGRYHLRDADESQLDAIVTGAAHPVSAIPASECPFCDDWQVNLEKLNPELNGTVMSVTPNQFRHHVGRHMQKLALFAIPRSLLEQDSTSQDLEASIKVAGSASTRSVTADIEHVCIDFPSAVLMVVGLQRWMSAMLHSKSRAPRHSGRGFLKGGSYNVASTGRKAADNVARLRRESPFRDQWKHRLSATLSDPLSNVEQRLTKQMQEHHSRRNH